MLLLFALLLALTGTNNFMVVAWKNTPPPSTVFKPREVCQQLEYEVGTFSCNTMACLTGDLQNWAPWVAARKDCIQRCQFSFSATCAFGDVFTKGKSGLMQSLWCQCSGVTPNSKCSQKVAPIQDLYPLLEFTKLSVAKQTCHKYCLNSPSMEMKLDQEHCDISNLEPTTQSPVITELPTNMPTTLYPTASPSTPRPTKPTKAPVVTDSPTKRPTNAPVVTDSPTRRPSTLRPSKRPTNNPTVKPTKTPTTMPTKRPTTRFPSKAPTATPTKRPTTLFPSASPTTAGAAKKGSLRRLFQDDEHAVTFITDGNYETDFDAALPEEFEFVGEAADFEDDEEEEMGIVLAAKAPKVTYGDYLCSCGSTRAG